jgi:hypothetical protein
MLQLPILVTLMVGTMLSSETSVLTGAMWHNTPEYSILRSYVLYVRLKVLLRTNKQLCIKPVLSLFIINFIIIIIIIILLK